MNLREIADMAGVSKTTVSRVINERPDVNPETRKHVQEIISQYDFYPNARAQAFSQKRSKVIGLVLPWNAAYTFSNPFTAELLNGILDAARAKGYHILLSYFMDRECFTLVRQKRVDGLLLLTADSDQASAIQELLELKIPVVSTTRIFGVEGLHYVAIDEYNATLELMDYLISLGHRDIAFLSGPQTLFSNMSRLKGYRDGLERHGIPFDERKVAYADGSIEEGEEAMRRLIETGGHITAIYIGGDLMAVGAKHVIETMGKRIPEDISMVSSDATSLTAFQDSPMTTMEQPSYKRGQLALEMLIDLIEGKETEGNILLSMGISIKKTTQSPKRKTVGKRR